jgi:hypothetical protein
MELEDFIHELQKENGFNYGLCPPPIKAEQGLDILIKHFLGDNWYTTMPLNKEQANAEAVYTIIEKHQKKTLFSRLFGGNNN